MKVNISMSNVTDDLRDRYQYVIGRALDDSSIIYEVEEDQILDTLKYLKNKFGQASFLNTFGRLYVSYVELDRNDKDLLFRSSDKIEHRNAWKRLLNEDNRLCTTM